jgi:hypothetical protein
MVDECGDVPVRIDCRVNNGPDGEVRRAPLADDVQHIGLGTDRRAGRRIELDPEATWDLVRRAVRCERLHSLRVPLDDEVVATTWRSRLLDDQLERA